MNKNIGRSMMKLVLILALCFNISSQVAQAKDYRNLSETKLSTNFIKAIGNPPLVLSTKVLDKIQKFEEHFGISEIGSVLDNMMMKTQDAVQLGFIHMEGQTIDDLIKYPELVKYMKENRIDHLPNFSSVASNSNQ
jgi:hypothetical protein